MKKQHRIIIEKVTSVLREAKLFGTTIHDIELDGYVLRISLFLPVRFTTYDLEKVLPNMQQELKALSHRMRHVGKYMTIEFGMRQLKNIEFSKDLLTPGTLQLKFPSSYGVKILDLEDGASCHLLNGGTTRMGKTCFLLYVMTCLFLQNTNIRFYVSSAKLKDFYPFLGIPNVIMEQTVEGTRSTLESLLEEYKRRNDLLYTDEFRKATDSKSIRKLYPHRYDEFKPIFLVIDEYARFAEDKRVQQLVTELVETAGFVNIHVIIASQRPDATTVLKPRIRANLLTRIAFTTSDRKNSEIILDREGAENLGKIPGRALLLDGDISLVQVPFLSATKCDELMKPYRKEVVNYEQETKRHDHSERTRQVQSLFEKSTSIFDLQRELKPNQRGKQGVKKTNAAQRNTTNRKNKK